MTLTDRIRALFAPAAQEPDASVPPNMANDVVYSESILYKNADWPKYNPDELLGAKGYLVYRKMMMDEQVKAVVRFKRDAITARQWYFDTKSSLEDDMEEAPSQNPSGGQPMPVANDPTNPLGSQQSGVSTNIRRKFDVNPAPAAPAQIAAPGQQPTDSGDGTPDPNVMPGDEEQSEPLSEKDAEEKELEFRASILTAAIDQMEGSFIDALNGIMTSLINGCSFTEKVFKNIDYANKTYVGIKHLRLKPFYSFKFYTDEYGNIDRVVQRWESQQEVEIPYEKFIHHIHNPDVDIHYGSSELRDAYRSWFAKDIIIRFMNIYLERMGGGFVWFETKQGASAPDKTTSDNIKSILTNLSSKNGILVPAGLELHVEYPKGTDAFERAISLHDKAIAKALLVPNLLGISEQGDTGSYSQSQTQLEAFLWTLDAEASRLAETINEQLIKPLCDINFGGPPYPVFKFEPISDTLKMNVIRVWNDLVKAGAVKPTDADSDHLRQLLDFPASGAPLSPPPSAPTPAGTSGSNPAQGSPDPSKAPNQPQDKGAAGPAGKDQPATKPAAVPDQTIAGRGQMRTSREESFARAASRVSFAMIDNKSQMITATGVNKIDKVMRESADALSKQVIDQNMRDNPEAIKGLRIPGRIVSKLRAAIDTAVKDAWALGIEHASREVDRAKEKKFAADQSLIDNAAQKFLESKAFTLAGDLSDNARQTVTQIIYNGIKGEWTLKEIENRIDDALESEVYPYIGTAVRTNVFDAINQARWEYFTDPALGGFVEAFEFSAILDGRTTEVCQHMNGKTYPVDSPVWDTYDPPLHFNCRSILVAITVRDQWKESSKPDVQPMEGFYSRKDITENHYHKHVHEVHVHPQIQVQSKENKK